MLLLALQLFGLPLRRFQQRLHFQAILDAVKRDCDISGRLRQKGFLPLGKFLRAAEFNHSFQFVFVHERHDENVTRRGFAQSRADLKIFVRDVGVFDAFALQRGLPNEAFAELETVADAFAPEIGIRSGQLQHGFLLPLFGEIERADLHLEILGEKAHDMLGKRHRRLLAAHHMA